jgi:tyrosyl-tRNA synthetase
MSEIQRTLLGELRQRGFIHDVSHFDELQALAEAQHISFYCGFDPTADSLHVGHMLPLIMMRRFQKRGHTPLALVGSATGMIGDPSFKSEERVLLTTEQIAHNVEGVEKQIRLFLDSDGPSAFKMVRNFDWLGKFSYIDFLRDVGKHFSVNAMINKESVRQRLENREQGISYTEFSYQLLQAYDFYHLYKEEGCLLQVGGSDQWGNITAGIDLIRRLSGPEAKQAYGLTFPLLTTSSGSKFGKTEAGAVWLDPDRTSPYQFYQYWLNSADEDVMRFMGLFTDVETEELESLAQATEENPGAREAQKRLASELTSIVHGAQENARAQAASQALFGGSLTELDSKTLLEIFQDVPSTKMAGADFGSAKGILDLLVDTGVAKSKGEGRRLVTGGGLYINNERVTEPNTELSQQSFIEDRVLIIRSGKKKYHLVLLG